MAHPGCLRRSGSPQDVTPSSGLMLGPSLPLLEQNQHNRRVLELRILHKGGTVTLRLCRRAGGRPRGPAVLPTWGYCPSALVTKTIEVGEIPRGAQEQSELKQDLRTPAQPMEILALKPGNSWLADKWSSSVSKSTVQLSMTNDIV